MDTTDKTELDPLSPPSLLLIATTSTPFLKRMEYPSMVQNSIIFAASAHPPHTLTGSLPSHITYNWPSDAAYVSPPDIPTIFPPPDPLFTPSLLLSTDTK